MDETKPLYIPDASVLHKWFVEEKEDHVEQALALRDAYWKTNEVRLAIPHYALAEIANAMGRDLPLDAATANFSRLLTFSLQEYSISLELTSLAFELMAKYPKTSFYDAGYHALALFAGGTFVTADEKYYAKTRKEGRVMLLKDYGKKH